jgi:dTDP-4-dehydrorhamnose 3,5-epimerase
MQFLPTELPDVIIVEPDVYPDDRGFFSETYHLRKYREGGIPSAVGRSRHRHQVACQQSYPIGEGRRGVVPA